MHSSIMVTRAAGATQRTLDLLAAIDPAAAAALTPLGANVGDPVLVNMRNAETLEALTRAVVSLQAQVDELTAVAATAARKR